MIHKFYNPSVQSVLMMSIDESDLSRSYADHKDEGLLTIAWNRGEGQTIIIDEVAHDFESDTIVTLMSNNTFEFSNTEDVVSWQFNREFYCIIDHDQEVSCAGFIFYGSREQLFIKLDDKNKKKFNTLLQVFEDEMEEETDIQEEMLRMLLKRLIILVTRLGKKQYLDRNIEHQEEDIIRKFNLLVEKHFKEYHQVQDYANLLHKSPKTLSNFFSKYSDLTPLQVIRNRIILEAKRLLRYTDKPSKEVAFELGYDDPATFSRFFKNAVKESPSAFKKSFNVS